MVFEPRTRRERVLHQAALNLARQLNPDLFYLLADVALAQAEEQVPLNAGTRNAVAMCGPTRVILNGRKIETE